LTTSTPEGNAHPSKKRRFPRFAVDIRLRLQVFRDGVTASFWGRSRELGQDGIGGTFTGELEPGEVVSLEFSLPVAVQPIKVRAIVRYRSGLYHGFEFLTLNQEQRDIVRRACDFLAAQV
jgi:hypothetical protein